MAASKALQLTELEQRIQRNFADTTQALLEIRDLQLYKGSYPTFQTYCQQRWELTEIQTHRLNEHRGKA